MLFVLFVAIVAGLRRERAIKHAYGRFVQEPWEKLAAKHHEVRGAFSKEARNESYAVDFLPFWLVCQELKYRGLMGAAQKRLVEIGRKLPPDDLKASEDSVFRVVLAETIAAEINVLWQR